MPAQNTFRADFDLEELRATFQSLDPEEAGKRAVIQVCEDMLDAVHTQIVAAEFESPARLNSKYKSGDPSDGGMGPSIVKTSPANKSGSAWQIHHNGGMNFTVKPRPEVRKRAVILEGGMPARHRDPEGEDPPYFYYVDGVPRHTYDVGAVKAHRYWEQAAIRVKQDNRIESYMNRNLEEQAEKGSLGSSDVTRPI